MNPDKIKFTPPAEKIEGTQYPSVFKSKSVLFYVLAFSNTNGIVISEGGEDEDCKLGDCSDGFDFGDTRSWENIGRVTVKINFDK